MNALLVANWPVLLAFAGGAVLGIVVGWLLRSWQEPTGAAARDKAAEADFADRARNAERRREATRVAAAIERRAAAVTAAADLGYADGSEEGPAILLIDDRLEMLGIHAAYLRKHGYRTLMAENGTTGLAFARTYHPALIVLDHSMPDRTGIEVARELKADPATAQIPILLMTALSYGAVGAAAMEAGCEAYLPKPIEPSRLLREIQARAPLH